MKKMEMKQKWAKKILHTQIFRTSGLFFTCDDIAQESELFPRVSFTHGRVEPTGARGYAAMRARKKQTSVAFFSARVERDGQNSSRRVSPVGLCGMP